MESLSGEIMQDIFREEKRAGADGKLISGAAEEGKDIRFSLTFDRALGVSDAELLIRRDGGNEENFPLEWESFVLGRDIWSVLIPAERLSAGLWFYRYGITAGGKKRSFGGEGEEILTENADRQLLIYDKSLHIPEKLKGAVIYHIFVDRFRRSGKCGVKDGAVLDPDWNGGIPQYGEYPGADVKNNVFFGGDLWGIAEKLDYIKALGTDYIYLSPVFDAYSNHKYDTGDYMTVDPMFGGDEALFNLIAEAGKIGIGIILDGVFNHTGDDSVYFNKYGKYPSLGAYQSKDSPYAEWYSFRSFPDDYECWWGVKILPRVNSSCESYRRFITDSVVRKWNGAGIAGWRLDVCDELSDGFLDGFRRAVRSYDPECAVIGEVWEDASNKISYGKRRSYFSAAQLDSVMNYPFRDAVISYVRDGDCGKFSDTVTGICRRYPKCVLDGVMNFLGTHDTERILTVLGGESVEGKSNADLAHLRMSVGERLHAVSLLLLALKIIAFLPGAFSVFYGDEVGTEGYRDPFCRRPFPWGREDTALLGEFRRTLRARKEEDLFCDGDFGIILLSPEFAVLERFRREERNSPSVICIINRTGREMTVSIPGKFRIIAGDAKEKAGSITLPACGGAWVSLPDGRINGDDITVSFS